MTITDVFDESQLGLQGYVEPAPGLSELRKLLLGGELQLYGDLKYSWIKVG